MNKKSKVIAYLLWLFLGLFGGHNYYSNTKIRGFIKLGCILVFVISLINDIMWLGVLSFFSLIVLWIIDGVTLNKIINIYNNGPDFYKKPVEEKSKNISGMPGENNPPQLNSEDQSPSSSKLVEKSVESKRTLENGDVYEGDFVNGKPHGKGKLTNENGGVYEGYFIDGEPHGKGKYTYSGGSFYEGDYVKGERTGKGKFIYGGDTAFHGDVYEGDFSNGKFFGKGKYTHADGSVYEGDFVDGKPNGKGKYIHLEGDVYEGDFVDGKLNGKGKATLANGNVLEGDFVDGKLNGKGKATSANGNVYEGDFVDGEPCGIEDNSNTDSVYGYEDEESIEDDGNNNDTNYKNDFKEQEEDLKKFMMKQQIIEGKTDIFIKDYQVKAHVKKQLGILYDMLRTVLKLEVLNMKQPVEEETEKLNTDKLNIFKKLDDLNTFVLEKIGEQNGIKSNEKRDINTTTKSTQAKESGIISNMKSEREKRLELEKEKKDREKLEKKEKEKKENERRNWGSRTSNTNCCATCEYWKGTREVGNLSRTVVQYPTSNNQMQGRCHRPGLPLAGELRSAIQNCGKSWRKWAMLK